MKTDCEIIRDLLPLYVDDICSEKSRELVEEHLQECAECSDLLSKLKKTEIESDLKKEKEDAISYGVRKFKQLSARNGITASGLFMIPLIALLVINLIAGSQLGWFLILLAALTVAASVIAVPILVPESKLFWTLCAFTASTELLLDVMTREHYDIKSMDLVRFIYETCGWDKKYTYRINGIAMPDHRMIVFDLTTALKVDEFR